MNEPVQRKSGEGSSESFKPQHLANLAWSVSILSYEDAKLLDAIAEASMATISEFGPLDLASTVWSFAKLEYRNEQLFASICQASVRLSDRFGAQEIALMADANASVLPDMEDRLLELAAGTASVLTSEDKAIEDWLQEMQLDRLGWLGTEMLQKQLALTKPSSVSQQRAEVFASQHFPESLASEVIAVAHLCLPACGLDATTVRGPATSSEGRSSTHLRAVRLPLSRWVDRARCSEFRALEEVCDRLLINEEFAGATGELDLWIFGAPPCLSCVGAIQQVRHLFPSLEVRVGFLKSFSNPLATSSTTHPDTS